MSVSRRSTVVVPPPSYMCDMDSELITRRLRFPTCAVVSDPESPQFDLEKYLKSLEK